MDKILENIYFNPEKAGSFTSTNKLYKAVKQIEDNKIDQKEIKKWLNEQDTYTTHKPVTTKFNRSKIFTKGIRDLFEADLMDMSNVSKYNNKTNFVLLVIDAFTRKLWAQPLKSKNAKDVLAAFNKIIKSSGVPKRVRSDSGTEFTNKLLQQFFTDNGIKHYTSHNEAKAAIVERVIRTIKKKINRYLSYKHTNKYIDVLQKIIDSYNNTYHKTIKMTPNSVNESNENELWKKLYLPTLTKKPLSAKLAVGDKVRISRLRETFPRGYYEGWTNEFFIIDKIIKSIPIRYVLKDYLDEPITGSFYEPELTKINKDEDSLFKVEKILRRRGRGRNREVLVKWLGWGDKFNSWEPASEIEG